MRVRARGGLRIVLVATVALVATTPARAATGDPAFSVDAQQLDDALDCPSFAHPDREPVLLVHGTGTRGHEQFDWNWLQVLPGMGFDVCVVTYPDRGLGDQQVAAEYVAHAVMTMADRSGRQVDLMGHSQGASMPRWAVRFWPSARAAIDDYVGIAGPYHGTDAVDAGQTGRTGDGAAAPQPAAFHQFQADSRFTTILDEGDETPGEIDWTNLATVFDELVQPVETAALDLGEGNPRVANLVLQDLCPGRSVDHLSIGTTDRLAFDLAVDAFTHDGPADPARLDLGPGCSVADQIVDGPQQLTSLVDIVLSGIEEGLPDLHLATGEPPTKAYATADGGGGASGAPTQDEPADGAEADDAEVDDAEVSAPPKAAPVTGTANTGLAGRPGLPATGGGLVVLGVGALGVAGLVRRRRGAGPR